MTNLTKTGARMDCSLCEGGGLVFNGGTWLSCACKEGRSEVSGTEARVCQFIASRQQLGLAKYGTSVEANPLSLLEWLRHQKCELADALIYCSRAIEEIEKSSAR